MTDYGPLVRALVKRKPRPAPTASQLCTKGLHAMTPDNTRTEVRGERSYPRCRQCERDRIAHQPPPVEQVDRKPFAPDAGDPDVQRFREEAKKRGVRGY